MAIKIHVHQNGNSVGEKGGKWYGYAKCETMIGASDLARILCTHGLALSEGTVIGVIRDLANVIRQQMMEGVAVKIDNLAIFKYTVESRGIDDLRDFSVETAVKRVTFCAQPTGATISSRLTEAVQVELSAKAQKAIRNLLADSEM